jgi:4-amino-4-deoxy-L-arabinose transferase-like glycosyltransferase
LNTSKRKLGATRIFDFLKQNLALLSILTGATLVSFFIGPFSNWDAQLEYGAASAVLQSGFPFTPNGVMLNQPPIGYYIDAVFFRGFGLSYGTGVAVVTLFGVGCVLLVYAVGREFYDARVGVLAAGLFALSPWHVLLSRSFLIDAQCLFFSLLFLLVGTWAIRKNSLKLFLITGILFGVAFLTKAFAVFTLIPLTLIFVHGWRKLSKPWLALAGFALPALFLNFLWYQLVSGQGFFALLRHDDLSNYLPGSLSLSPFFVGNFLLSPYGLGVCFSIAVALSLAVGFFGRKLFASFVWFDVICFGTVVGISGLVRFLLWEST